MPTTGTATKAPAKKAPAKKPAAAKKAAVPAAQEVPTPRRRDAEEVDAQVRASIAARRSNTGIPIDFTAGLPAQQLETERRKARSAWPQKMRELLDGVHNGSGEYDTFYKVGEFRGSNGATTTARTLCKTLAGLGDEFSVILFETRIVTGDAGERNSELWAAVEGSAPLNPEAPATTSTPDLLDDGEPDFHDAA